MSPIYNDFFTLLKESLSNSKRLDVSPVLEVLSLQVLCFTLVSVSEATGKAVSFVAQARLLELCFPHKTASVYLC